MLFYVTTAIISKTGILELIIYNDVCFLFASTYFTATQEDDKRDRSIGNQNLNNTFCNFNIIGIWICIISILCFCDYIYFSLLIH